MNLKGKVTVVTGAGNGIGAAIARKFAAEGARVLVSDLDVAAAERVAGEITANGGTAVSKQADVTREVDVQDVVAQAVSEWGPVDLICSNAGAIVEGGVDAPDDRWTFAFNVNVMAHVYAARAVLPSMLERGEGYILSTASAAGLLTSPGAAPYAVSKHGAVALAEWLSVMHGSDGIKVSVICPQAVDTNMLKGSIEGGNKASEEFSKVGKLLTADETADVVVQGVHDETFLILPHPEVLGMVQKKFADEDRWLKGMQKFLASVVARIA